MVFPGMGASDVTTVPLRRYLRSLGYVTQAWGQGFNFGPRPGVIERAADDMRALAERHGQPVSLIGWSLGGIYARELAKMHPEATRCVITLGTPFTGHPKATNAWRIYELLSRSKVGDAERDGADQRSRRRCRRRRSIRAATASSRGAAASTSPGRWSRTSRCRRAMSAWE